MALTDSLEVYWKMDEASGTREDSTAANNDLTDNNTVGSATGIISLGADFVAANSEYLSTATELDAVFTSNAWSVSLWAKPDDVTSTYALISRDVALNRQFLFAINSAGLYFERAGLPITNTSTGITTDFQHIVLTYNGTNLVAYINTVQNDSDAMTALPSVDASIDLNIGRREFVGSNYYANAIIDEVGIWSKVLSSDEITELYNGGAGFTYPFVAASATLARRRMMTGIGA